MSLAIEPERKGLVVVVFALLGSAIYLGVVYGAVFTFTSMLTSSPVYRAAFSAVYWSEIYRDYSSALLPEALAGLLYAHLPPKFRGIVFNPIYVAGIFLLALVCLEWNEVEGAPMVPMPSVALATGALVCALVVNLLGWRLEEHLGRPNPHP